MGSSTPNYSDMNQNHSYKSLSRDDSVDIGSYLRDKNVPSSRNSYDFFTPKQNRDIEKAINDIIPGHRYTEERAATLAQVRGTISSDRFLLRTLVTKISQVLNTHTLNVKQQA